MSRHRTRLETEVDTGVSAPRRWIAAPLGAAVATSVALTLLEFTIVGERNRPLSVGNGGLLRGSPLKPSIELKRAVSSPQIYAPAP